MVAGGECYTGLRSIRAVLGAYDANQANRNALPFDGVTVLEVCVPNIVQGKKDAEPLASNVKQKHCLLFTNLDQQTHFKNREQTVT